MAFCVLCQFVHVFDIKRALEAKSMQLSCLQKVNLNTHHVSNIT